MRISVGSSPLRALFLGVSSALLAACAGTPVGEKPRPSPDRRLSLAMRGSYAVVEARLPGVERPLHLVVDSAAGGGVIDLELARVAGLLTNRTDNDVQGASGSAAPTPIAEIAGMRIGDMTINGEFITTDTKAFNKKPEEMVDGILGNDVTASYDATFDIEGGELLLRARAPDKGTCHANSYPERSEALKRFAFIDVTLPGGVKARTVIDTGAPITIVNQAAAEALGLQPGDPRLRSDKGLGGMGDGAKADTTVYDLPAWKIGDWNPGPTEVRVSELPIFALLSPYQRPAMILGIDVLRKRRFTIERNATAFCLGEPAIG